MWYGLNIAWFYYSIMIKVQNHENTLIDLAIRSSIPSTLSIHSIGIPSIPNLAPKQAPITVALEQQSPEKCIQNM